MLEMSDFDIYLDYKNAKRPEEQIKILAELNATTPDVIREIINKKIEEEQRMLERSKLEEQRKQSEEERKAKKAAYMKKYWERKKAEKDAAKTQQEETQQEETEQKPEEPKTQQDDSELIRKAIQYYSADLADAVMMQRERVEEEQEKLRQMEADLKRCQEILGYELEVEEGEGE